jgi:Fe-S-cluster-containing dehydrogenase component
LLIITNSIYYFHLYISLHKWTNIPFNIFNMSRSKKQDSDNRRSFLRKIGGITLGSAAAMAGGVSLANAAGIKSGDKVKLLSLDGSLIEVDRDDISMASPVPAPENRNREGIPGKKFVMVIDLAKCRNAKKCMKACQQEHQLHPSQHHINVLEMQDTEKTAPYFMPKPCQHCDNPPCTFVCPVDATFKRSDGIVLIDNERCIGCRFCIAACPYSARSFNWKEPKDASKYAGQEYDIEKNVPQKKGTVTKCVFSADRLRENKLPYCVSACPNGVYYFGDYNEDAVTNGTTKETVRLSELLAENGGYQLMPELGTKPSVFYLPPKNRMFKFDEAKKESNI